MQQHRTHLLSQNHFNNQPLPHLRSKERRRMEIPILYLRQHWPIIIQVEFPYKLLTSAPLRVLISSSFRYDGNRKLCTPVCIYTFNFKTLLYTNIMIIFSSHNLLTTKVAFYLVMFTSLKFKRKMKYAST